MAESTITLCVPAEASYARSVRMMAANLAVLCSMSVDDVEDARMAAEEAFVYACATQPQTVEMSFAISPESLTMAFSLGEGVPTDDLHVVEQVSLAQMLLAAVSDSYEFAEDGSTLHVTKLVGGAHAG